MISAIGTVDEVGAHSASAVGAQSWSTLANGFRRNALVVIMSVAVLTDPEGSASFDWKKRDKKKAQVMVHSFLADLRMAAERAYPCLFCQGHCFGLNAPYKEEHLHTLSFVFSQRRYLEGDSTSVR